MSNLKSSWSSYSAISKALSKLPLPEQHHWFYGIAHVVSCTCSILIRCIFGFPKSILSLENIVDTDQLASAS